MSLSLKTRVVSEATGRITSFPSTSIMASNPLLYSRMCNRIDQRPSLSVHVSAFLKAEFDYLPPGHRIVCLKSQTRHTFLLVKFAIHYFQTGLNVRHHMPSEL
jgi:hypothetical protein